MSVLLMLRSPTKTVSAPAVKSILGLNPPPRALAVYASWPASRPVLTQHSLPGGLLGLPCAGLPPAGSRQLPGARFVSTIDRMPANAERDYLGFFDRCRSRSRTPGPPPFSSMNSTPANSKASPDDHATAIETAREKQLPPPRTQA
jgi:hypothetical protein